MIIIFAGRRADSLPAEHELDARLRRLLSALKPSAVVGAAADGGDLLVLEAALSRPDPPSIHLVLPTQREIFLESSVREDWRERFERVLARASQAESTITELGLPDGADAYRQANQRMLELATTLVGGDERAVGLVIASEGQGQMIADFTAQADLRAVPVLRLDPAANLAARPSCFVAMPFGRKLDVQRGIQIDCDLVYEKILVPALEHAQLRFRRGDEQIDSGVVLQPMLESLADADLVIADLATGNFNVGWELGLRHLLRRRHTVLMLPEDAVAPFDLAPLRHVSYANQETGITDEASIAAWAALAPYLSDLGVGARSDSPVDVVMEVEQWARVRPRGARDERWESLREQLALARDLHDVPLMLATAHAAGDLPLPQRQLVRAEAGAGLVRLNAYEEARRLLAELVAADDDYRRPDVHLFYAQALYRPSDANVNDLDEAERVLTQLLASRPGHPEVWAALGALAKRRSRRRRARGPQRADVQLAMRAYLHDYERDLNAFYEGINVVACGAALELVHGDEHAGERARILLPAVQVASTLASERDPRDFWAAVTVAEGELHRVLLGFGDDIDRVAESYRSALRRTPPPGDMYSSLSQLEWLAQLGIENPALAAAEEPLQLALGAAA